MNNRQHPQNILARKSDRSGFWHGHPHPDSMPAYRKYFAAEDVGRAARDGLGILSGMWCPFFHIAADFFGMDKYFLDCSASSKLDANY